LIEVSFSKSLSILISILLKKASNIKYLYKNKEPKPIINKIIITLIIFTIFLFDFFLIIALLSSSILSSKLLSSSANSSIDISNIFASNIIFSNSGIVFPTSHFDTVCLDTPTFSPNSSCDNPLLFLNSKIFHLTSLVLLSNFRLL